MKLSSLISLASVAGATCAAHAQISELPADLYQRELSPNILATARASLPESVAVDSVFLDPEFRPVISIAERATVTVTFIDEGAGYRNSLVWIACPSGTFSSLRKSQVDSDLSGIVSLNELASLPGLEFGLVFPNVSRAGGGGLLVPGDAVDIGGGREFEPGTEIIFCLLQNAWRNGFVEGYDIEIESTISMYGLDMINPEAPSDATVDTDSASTRSRHVAMLFGDDRREQVIMGFEDLHRTQSQLNDYRIRSDEDFNDAVFIVTSTPAEAISQTYIPDADPAYNPRPAELFYNPDCCGIDTTTILEEQLPERTNVNADFLNPEYEPTVVLSDDSFVILSFIGEGAIYQNSLGYISYPAGALDAVTREIADADADGIVEPWELRLIAGVEIGMVFAHASVSGGGGALEPTEAVIVGSREFSAGSRIDFFLVQDGWNDNGTVKDFLRDTADDTHAFYTIDRFNPEPDINSRRHVAMLFTDDSYQSVLLGIEDLHRTDRTENPNNYLSDEDFNDNVFCISSLTIGAISDTNVPVAGESCRVDIDENHRLDVFDVMAFVQIFMSQDPKSDFVLDGTLNVFDVIAFVEEFNLGCP